MLLLLGLLLEIYFLNSKTVHLNFYPRPKKMVEGSGKSFETPVQNIFHFAEKVVRKIEEKYPEALTDFIMRVDCFEVQSTLILGGDDGSEETTIVELKLNEVESFDANYQIDFILIGVRS